MNSILLVEDDTGIASFMKLELTHEGYSVDTAEDGRSGLELFEAKQYQLVLLDIMLPVLNGIEVLRRIRKISTVPVILVSARSETTDAVTGLDSGADDYITKPFAIEELLARIRSALRRNNFTGKNPEAEQSSIIKSLSPVQTTCCFYIWHRRKEKHYPGNRLLILCGDRITISTVILWMYMSDFYGQNSIPLLTAKKKYRLLSKPCGASVIVSWATDNETLFKPVHFCPYRYYPLYTDFLLGTFFFQYYYSCNQDTYFQPK